MTLESSQVLEGQRQRFSPDPSEKMAENAGVDLSDALRDLQSAIAEAYPKSHAAKTYPREVAVARAHIDAALAARRQRN
jgi:hypothetical protein